MADVAGSIWWLIVSLGILITFHEWGHYWVARRCGVKVLRFSVGFGRTLWSRRGPDGTEFVLAALPLGGYVKMLDEREGDVPADQLAQAFNRKSVYQRFAVVAAGPLANLLLAVFLLWLMFMLGKGDYAPVIGRASELAAEAGLRDGDRIVRIDDEAIATWTDAGLALGTAAMDRRPVRVEVSGADGGDRSLRLDLSRIDPESDDPLPLRQIGLLPRHLRLAPEIGSLSADSPAAKAGLLVGDRILRVDDQAVEFFDDLSPALNRQRQDDTAARLLLERAGERREISIQPQRLVDDAGAARWILGVGPKPVEVPHDALLRYGPLEAMGAALSETQQLTGYTLGMLWRMLSGIASLQNVSGPISIAQFANESAQMGLAWFLSFLALLSLSLCIMNLLPIPILDGGHLLYYLIEMIKGGPVSERMLVAGQYIGLAFLVSLMGLALYNDIMRLVG